MRVTEKQLRNLEKSVSAGLSEAGLDIWVSILDNGKGGKTVTVWMSPMGSRGKKEALEEEMSIREAYYYLRGILKFRGLFRRNVGTKIAALFGLKVVENE